MTTNEAFKKVRIALMVLWFFEQVGTLFMAAIFGISVSFIAFLIVHMISSAIAVKVFLVTCPISTLITFIVLKIEGVKERLVSQKTCNHTFSMPLRPATMRIEAVMLCLSCKKTYYEEWETEETEIE